MDSRDHHPDRIDRDRRDDGSNSNFSEHLLVLCSSALGRCLILACALVWRQVLTHESRYLFPGVVNDRIPYHDKARMRVPSVGQGKNDDDDDIYI